MPLRDTADRRKHELLRNLLSQVSRSFYLSLKWLPGTVRDPISLAYLLARTSDTIADTRWIATEQRLHAIERLAGRISGRNADPVDFRALVDGQGDPAEGILLKRAEDSLALLEDLSGPDREKVRRVLATIISGQILDLKRFANASQHHIVALETVAELEDYTYRVAGCVGEFWTRVCLANLSPHSLQPSLTEPEMIELGIRYGRGLQLVNILRDLPRDLRQGRCYLPTDQLQSVGLSPRELLELQTEHKLRPVYDTWLDQAQSFLADGWTYTNAYPRAFARVRISCALPILIGWRTLHRLRTGCILDPNIRIKVSRGEVKRLVLQTLLCHPIEPLWQRLAAGER